MQLVKTAPHEFTANYQYKENGLRPFFAVDRRVKDGGGTASAEFRFGGQTWSATLYYQDSGIVHPGETTPTGTPFELESLREFRIQVRALDDTGQRKFNAHIAPRWQGMKVERKDGTVSELSVPEGLTEGINVRVSGSNIEFERYLDLLQQAARTLDIRWDYFADPFDSNIQDAERYVRLHKNVSGPIHARDGPIAAMGHLLENDREGYRKVVQNDQNECGETLSGYYHTVTLGEKRIREVFPDHALPKEVKHYYAREALSRSETDPLRHPKLGASYQVNRWDGKLTADAEGIQQLNHEIEETIISVLHDAGLDVRPGGGTFVKDAYFDANESDRERELVSLELTQLRQSQESVVVKHLADGLSPVEWEALSVLVADGGEVSPRDIAESGGFHKDSVYRALDRIEGMLDREYGCVSLRSTYVGELVHDAVKEARESTRRAVEAGAKALESAERGLDKKTSAFIAWRAKHDLTVNERDSGVSVDFGRIEADTQKQARKKVRRLLRQGLKMWEDMNRDPVTYHVGSWRAKVEVPEHNLRSIDAETRVHTIGGNISQSLR